MNGAAIVGELNPYGQDPRYALYHEPRNASGDRLRRILGLTVRSYVPIQKYNLCSEAWSTEKARWRAKGLIDECDVLVLLGSKVRHAFERWTLEIEPFKVHTLLRPNHRVLLIPLPHPSGMCREWNQPEAVLGARELVKQYAGLPCGEVEEFFRAPVRG